MAEKYVAKSELDSALEGLCKKYNVSYGEESMGFGRELAELSDRLAADVQPERNGIWKVCNYDDTRWYECSECGHIPILEGKTRFCLCCGAKMCSDASELAEDLEALINIVEERNNRVSGQIEECVSDSSKGVDVRSERHGRWSDKMVAVKEEAAGCYDVWFGFQCSECGAVLNKTKYCGSCGTKMDGGEENG